MAGGVQWFRSQLQCLHILLDLLVPGCTYGQSFLPVTSFRLPNSLSPTTRLQLCKCWLSNRTLVPLVTLIKSRRTRKGDKRKPCIWESSSGSQYMPSTTQVKRAVAVIPRVKLSPESWPTTDADSNLAWLLPFQHLHWTMFHTYVLIDCSSCPLGPDAQCLMC